MHDSTFHAGASADTPAASRDLSRTLLIGPGDALDALVEHLCLLEPTAPPAGCVVLEGSPPAGLDAVGGLADLPGARERLGLTRALVTLPVAWADRLEPVLHACHEAGLRVSIARPLEEVVFGAVGAGVGSRARRSVSVAGVHGPSTSGEGGVDLAALIGREPRAIDHDAVSSVLTGKRVLVTGAGGSIGSELVRIAAGYEPEELILMERSENALFEIDRRMQRWFPRVARRAVLHDVVDGKATLAALAELRPHAVFHAAAHKHVPLMEDHPAHALTNNLFGTRSIAEASWALGVERFVMISSDKAVRPTSVMGATKRLAELFVQGLSARSRVEGGPTRCSIVRFGNVLGSACSVLPIWSAQMIEGGPVTVTDERMTRYFMTIHEAASLVIQSAATDPDTGDVFVLDMGEPINILELAQRFVRAHGLEPRLAPPAGGAPAGPGAVDVVLTGARPGEKLHEELAYAAERLRPTRFDGIHAWRASGVVPEPHELATALAPFRSGRTREDVLKAIGRFVPELAGRAETGEARARAA